jgi:hypothetical protein
VHSLPSVEEGADGIQELLEVYGPCISTADAKNWPRHRKILAAPFNESAMSYVWSESLQQTRQMVEAWSSMSSAGIPSVAKDTRTLSLNVLAAIGFRRSFEFRSSDDSAPVRERGMFSYRDALQIVLDNSILLMLIPRHHLIYSWMPKALQRIGLAASDFKKHMVQMLDEETKLLNQGEKGSGSLMTSFLRALDAKDKDTGSSAPQGLSVDEIFGNIFVINFAGHDTTANTLAFSTLLLAAYPDVQQWVAEELANVIGEKPQEEWNYADLYPRLKRCQAVLVSIIDTEKRVWYTSVLTVVSHSSKRFACILRSWHFRNGRTTSHRHFRSLIVKSSFRLTLEFSPTSLRPIRIPNTGTSPVRGNPAAGSSALAVKMNCSFHLGTHSSHGLMDLKTAWA